MMKLCKSIKNLKYYSKFKFKIILDQKEGQIILQQNCKIIFKFLNKNMGILQKLKILLDLNHKIQIIYNNNYMD